MHNMVTAEFMKLKKNKLFVTSIIIAIAVPSLIILKDLLLQTGVQRIGLNEWIRSMMMVVSFLVFPILSGFIITYLIQREYAEQTIINTLTAPTSRSTFIIGKVIVWALWHIALTILSLIVTYIGCWLLFSDSFHISEMFNIAMLFIKSSAFNFVSLMPILYIAIKQRTVFYPSLLVCFLFAVIEISSMNLPIVLASVMPWSAVVVLSYSEAGSIFYTVGLISLAICGLVSMVLSIYSFKQQNL